MNEIRLGSLFDGIGVFPLAAVRCGIVPAWASEIEKAPISITKRHFPGMAHLGDVTKLNGGDIPPVHIITFGSPCQNLSQIGNRAGLAGEKSSLFFHAIRIIREMREATNGIFPAIAVWENVMGAFFSNDRMDFRAVLSAFTAADISIDFSKSMHYNPLSYIRNEADILKFVNALITNTKGEGKEGDPFWTKAETLLYCALIAYIIFEGPAEDRNMNTLVDMISGMEVKEDDENYKNAVDYMFDGLAKRKPDCFAVKQYRKFKLSSGKTAKSILISCGARLAPFDIPQLREIMSYDELELDRMGDRRTATFFLHQRHGQHLQFPCGAGLFADVQPPV